MKYNISNLTKKSSFVFILRQKLQDGKDLTCILGITIHLVFVGFKISVTLKTI